MIRPLNWFIAQSLFSSLLACEPIPILFHTFAGPHLAFPMSYWSYLALISVIALKTFLFVRTRALHRGISIRNMVVANLFTSLLGFIIAFLMSASMFSLLGLVIVFSSSCLIGYWA